MKRAQSNRNLSTDQILKKAKQEKKRSYNDRIIQVENGTFTPLIFGTNGAMDYECENVQLRDLTNTLLQWIGYGHV